MDIGPASSQIFLSFTCMIGTTGFVELEQNISSASNNSLSVISHSSKGSSFDSIRLVKNFLVIPGSSLLLNLGVFITESLIINTLLAEPSVR